MEEGTLGLIRKDKSRPLGLTLGLKISLRLDFCFIMVLEFPLQGMNEKRNTYRKRKLY